VFMLAMLLATMSISRLSASCLDNAISVEVSMVPQLRLEKSHVPGLPYAWPVPMKKIVVFQSVEISAPVAAGTAAGFGTGLAGQELPVLAARCCPPAGAFGILRFGPDSRYLGAQRGPSGPETGMTSVLKKLLTNEA